MPSQHSPLYTYELPPELVAKEPASPRDSARLFVYDTANDTIVFDVFRNLHNYLPKKSFLVLNDTKVIPARLPGVKESGGKIELLLLPDEKWGKQNSVRAMVDRKLAVGQKVYVAEDIFLAATHQDKNIFTFEPNFEAERWSDILDAYGQTPVPPYLLPTPLPEAITRERYQTIFAKTPASVAAPTASLHFTEAVFKALDQASIPRVHVTLHVGMGTFAPLTQEQIEQNRLHPEFGEISTEAADHITSLKARGYACVAVGTTATRVVESHAREGRIEAGSGMTDIFISPPYTFQTVDALITNFHLPQTSLMMLVEAFLQHKGAQKHVADLYEIAIKEKFRFYSFGDAMLIV